MDPYSEKEEKEPDDSPPDECPEEGSEDPTIQPAGEADMSNGNNPNEPSGNMKTIKIVMTAEDYGVVNKEWLVPEELLRPYAIAYDAGVAALGLEISKAIYEKVIEEGGGADPEMFLAMEMIEASQKAKSG